jgi:hypothetical protein
MKKPFSKYDSEFLLSLLLFIGLLSIRSGKYTYIVNILFFICLFIYYRPVLSKIFLGMFLIAVFLTMWGIISGNQPISIAGDFVIFSPLILLFFYNRQINNDLITRIPNFLANSLFIMLPISFAIFVYMDYKPGSMLIGRFNYDVSTKLHLFAPIIPLMSAPYLIFFLDKLNKKQELLIHCSMICIILMGIMTLSKSIILACLIPYLLRYGYKYLIQKIRPFKVLIILIILSLFYSGNYLTVFTKKIGLEYSFTGVIERTQRQYESNTFSSGRVKEVEDYFSQDLSFFEYMFGRGMGGHKVRDDADPHVGGINLMHFGIFHLFLKGGILLVLVLYVPIFLAILRFWKTPDYHISLILIYFLCVDAMTTSWGWSFSLFFYWYGISFYFFQKLRIRPWVQSL